MNPSVSVTPAVEKAVKKPGLREFALLFSIAWLAPLVLHFMPSPGAVTLDAYLLPLFWGALVAVYVYGAGVALLVGLSAPLLTFAIARFPEAHLVGVASVEVAVFVLVTGLLIPRAPGFWWIGPFGGIAAKLLGAVVAAWLPLRGQSPTSFLSLLVPLQGALPGLAALALINAGLVKRWPRRDDWDDT